MIVSILTAALAFAAPDLADPPKQALERVRVTSVAPSSCSSGVLACYARITVATRDQASLDLFLIAEPDTFLPASGETCDFEVQRGLFAGGVGDRLPRSADRLEISRISCTGAAPKP
ncbi:MAG: hypothetical protein QM608_14430 [Caulobacter sp.]